MDLFAWNCCSRTINDLIRTERVFEKVPLFRKYYHSSCQRGQPNECSVPENLIGQRLVTLSPRYLSVNDYWSPVPPDVLAQLAPSLISLTLEGSVSKKGKTPFEKQHIEAGVIGKLTGLRFLDLDVCPGTQSMANKLWDQLAQLTKLMMLIVFCEAKVKSFSFLAKLTRLRHLDFWSYSTLRIEDVAHLPVLNSLVLNDEELTADVNKLASLKNLYIRPSFDDDDDSEIEVDTSIVTAKHINVYTGELSPHSQFVILEKKPLDTSYYWPLTSDEDEDANEDEDASI
jgi:hypothetical protein